MVGNINTDATGANKGHGHDQNHDFGFQVAYITQGSVNDPEKRGRYAISNFEQANIPAGQETWIPSMTNNSPQLKGIGSFGDMYLPGSRVVVGWHGPHKFIIGAVPNVEPPDNNKSDYNNAAKDKHGIQNTGAPDKQKEHHHYLAWGKHSNCIYDQGKQDAQGNANQGKQRPKDNVDACQNAHQTAMSADKLKRMIGELAQPGLNHIAHSMGPIPYLGIPR